MSWSGQSAERGVGLVAARGGKRWVLVALMGAMVGTTEKRVVATVSGEVLGWGESEERKADERGAEVCKAATVVVRDELGPAAMVRDRCGGKAPGVQRACAMGNAFYREDGRRR